MSGDDKQAIPSALDQEIGSFNAAQLRHTEVQEKNVLPSKEG